MLATFVLSAAFCFQSVTPVVINEFSYDDSSTDDREFVELYNRSSSNVNIGGWKLAANDPFGPNLSYTVPANTVLKAGGYYVFGSAKVPNVNQIVGVSNLWENSNESLELYDANGKLLDSLVYEANKGRWTGSKEEGEGVWGNFVSIDLVPTSWSRLRDGWDTNNNRDFHLRPLTPGATNNLKPLTTYLDTFDTKTVGTALPEWGGSFKKARVIDPTQASTINPNAIKASPQGKNAAIFWDEAGGGNANMLLFDTPPDVLVEAYVYFDAKPEGTGEFETWSLGVQGSTGTFYNTPDPSGSFSFTANGNTGVSWTFQNTSSGGVLYLIDHGDGGWGTNAKTKPVILGKITVTAGKNDGWQRLRLEVHGSWVEGFFGGTYGKGDGVRVFGKLQAPVRGGVYVGYREFVLVNSTTRPFTCDLLQVRVPKSAFSLYGTAKATTKGTPAILPSGFPVTRSPTFKITGKNLVPGSVALYVLGTAKVNFDLSLIGGQTGSFLQAAPMFVFGVPTSTQGTSALPVPIPAGVASGTLYWQILDLDPSLTVTLKLGNSQGLSTTIGN